MDKDKSTASAPPNTYARDLRKVAVIVLLAGLAISGVLYFLGGDPGAEDDGSMSSQYYKSDEAQSQRMWGREGSVVLGVTRSLKRVRTYAYIVAGLAVVVAIVCFRLAEE